MNPWVMFIVALAIFTAGGLAAHEFDQGPLNAARLETSHLETKVEKNRADANQATIDGITNSLNATLAAEGRRLAADRARQARTAAFIEALSHAPDSKNCAGSAAFRALIDSVRNEPGGPSAH